MSLRIAGLPPRWFVKSLRLDGVDVTDTAFELPPDGRRRLEITLSDLDETRIAMRRFQPRDYVNDARTIAGGLAPGASTALVFEVADPGRNAVAFEFKFGE